MPSEKMTIECKSCTCIKKGTGFKCVQKVCPTERSTVSQLNNKNDDTTTENVKNAAQKKNKNGYNQDSEVFPLKLKLDRQRKINLVRTRALPVYFSSTPVLMGKSTSLTKKSEQATTRALPLPCHLSYDLNQPPKL